LSDAAPPAPNPYRGEVSFRLTPERELTLKLTWNAVAAISSAWRPDAEALKAETGNESADWGGVLNRAIVRYDVEKIAFFLAACAQHHHPDVTTETIMAASPPWHYAYGACEQLPMLFWWGALSPPSEVTSAATPFVLRTLSGLLSKLRPHAA